MNSYGASVHAALHPVIHQEGSEPQAPAAPVLQPWGLHHEPAAWHADRRHPSHLYHFNERQWITTPHPQPGARREHRIEIGAGTSGAATSRPSPTYATLCSHHDPTRTHDDRPTLGHRIPVAVGAGM